MDIRIIIHKFFVDIYIDVVLVLTLSILIFIFRSKDALLCVGLSLTLISMVFWVISRLQLKSAFSIHAEAKMLVTHGVYSKINHPIYLFSSLAVLGLVIALKSFYLFIPWLILLVIQYFRIKKENTLLESVFDERYKQHRKQTWF